MHDTQEIQNIHDMQDIQNIQGTQDTQNIQSMNDIQNQQEHLADSADQQIEQEDLYDLMRACGHILYHSGSSKTGQGRILHILDQTGDVSQKDLQSMLGIQSGSVSEILAKLEKEELIERRKDERDRRKVIVSMTEKGREHSRQYHKNPKEKDWFAALDDAQRSELKNLLQLLLDSWKELE